MRDISNSVFSLLLLLSLAEPVLGADPKDEAKVRFDKGVALFKDADYDAALVEFKAAYAVQPHFAVRYNIGITLNKLHRYAEAEFELQLYLAEGGEQISNDRVLEVKALLEKIRDLVGSLSIKCGIEGAHLVIDDEPSHSWLIRLDVGEHVIKVTADGYEPYTKKIDVPGNKASAITIDLVPLAGKKKPPKVAKNSGPKKKIPVGPFAAMAALTGALALTATITGALSLSREKTYADMEYTDDWRAYRDSTRSLTVATDVLWGLVGASAITAVVLAIFTEFRGKEKKKKQAWMVNPLLGVGGFSFVGE